MNENESTNLCQGAAPTTPGFSENDIPQKPADQLNKPAVSKHLSKKRKSNTGIVITIVVVLLLAILGGAGYWYYHSTQAAESEQTAYEILENNDNPQDYEDFLAKYPNSRYAAEVQTRLDTLREMLQAWKNIALSDNLNDFKNFKLKYNNTQYEYLCDIKIDSLEWIQAQRLNTEDAYQSYLDAHPEGKYASEASIAMGQIRDSAVTDVDRDGVIRVCADFFEGFQSMNEAKICSNITATMTTFLSQKDVTKAQVVQTIKGMFSEHISSCEFVVNRDIQVERGSAPATSASDFVATFTVDQYIHRDNEGKTFGSYKCVAVLNAQMLISSLTMTEISANR